MIVNNRCCRNLNCVKQSIWQNDRGVYFEVRNRLEVSVFFILQYSLQSGTVTLTSNIIAPGGSDKINFPNKGINICANVLQANQERTFICNVCITNPFRTCIEVFRNASGQFIYREVLC